MRALATFLCAVLLAGCASEPQVFGDAVAHGKAVFVRPSANTRLACANCHATGNELPAASILTGGKLGGATLRTSFWGGAEADLLRSINLCRRWFQAEGKDWAAGDDDAQAMWAFLATLPGDATPAVPFGVVASVQDVTNGKPASGQQVFAKACQTCHGALHTGKGQISPAAYALPEQFVANHAKYAPLERRLTFIEKVRHGPFLGYGGNMPPFSAQVLSDGQVGDLLAAMGL